jgi:hypothetical protein
MRQDDAVPAEVVGVPPYFSPTVRFFSRLQVWRHLRQCRAEQLSANTTLFAVMLQAELQDDSVARRDALLRRTRASIGGSGIFFGLPSAADATCARVKVAPDRHGAVFVSDQDECDEDAGSSVDATTPCCRGRAPLIQFADLLFVLMTERMALFPAPKRFRWIAAYLGTMRPELAGGDRLRDRLKLLERFPARLATVVGEAEENEFVVKKVQ